MNNFWAILFGSFLAFTGGLAAYFIQFNHTRSEQRKLVKEFIRELLNDFIRIAPKIREDYSKTQIIWNDTLQRMNDGIVALDRNKEHVFLIKDEGIKVKILDFFSKLRTTINLCYTLNSWVGSQNKLIQEFAAEEIKKQPSKLQGLEIEARDILEELT